MAEEDKNMKKVSVGIDSSGNLRFSMIVIGSEGEVNSFFQNMCRIFSERGVKVMHYKEIDKRIIRSVSSRLADLINNSGVSFLAIEHKKPLGEPHRKYFIDYVPQRIAEHFEPLDDRNRLIQIDVHDDYRVPGVHDSTKAFMDSLIRKIARQFSPESGIKILPDGKSNFETSKVLSKKGNYIKIRICCTNQRNSKAINIADMALGLYKEYGTMVSRKIRFRKI